ncbi:DUF362 domain-containing protein [Candidatus Woesearchaeota archaeon]|nr:DUF362 domain-containing protein [Candidatus Woesearchaeota archaeon]
MIIRWVCEKCSKRWIYPIEKCVYCKGPVIKQKGTNLKVIGITKVTIPSPMHPIIPYNIILLQDEHGNRLPKKTMKEYKIGDNYTEQKAKSDDAVSIIKVKYDIYEAIKESLELLNSIEIGPNDRILIKPSIVTAAYQYQAINTNHEFLDGLLNALYDYGIKKENIIVAEHALPGSDVMDAASKAGILEVCKKHGVQFADISKGHFEEIESDGYKFRIYKEVLNRKIINAPIMKTNFQIGVSGAVENLSRLVDEKTLREMYYNDINMTLPKLVKLLKTLTIADATNGMQGQGPLALGEPAFLNLVYAGRNPAALDTVFCEAAMLAIPEYVETARENLPIKSIEVVGNDIDAIRYPLHPTISDETPHPDIKVTDGRACPACLNLMYNLTSKLIGLRGEEINLVIGSMIDESVLKKERVVVLGDCAIRRLQELKVRAEAEIPESLDRVEQIVLLKKLLETKGTPKITPVDKVISKMKKLLSRVVG